ncbi:hypothetical protein CEXT_387781 [Caerostris extrusa]|uniref:Uncharacterized protein n=1 Tax=Caerostris extrusa TaxID=172846 RepID=A0AAV4MUI5_CAEEX|nr:hypothetical protein CEXT_387781 [Caerostris extrusa]
MSRYTVAHFNCKNGQGTYLSIRFYLSIFIDCCKCGSIAVTGNRGGAPGHGETTENWSVLSPGTQIFLLILGIVLCIFFLYGLYRLYAWCKLNPRKGHR